MILEEKLVQLTMLGLTLIYCTWISPEEIFNSATSNNINACSIVLFVITERWPGARKYRDAYETVKQCVIDPLAEGKNQGPREAIDFLKSIIPSTMPSSEMGEDRQEFSRIVTDMAGQSVESTSAQPFARPTPIGMEQVQYQLGDLFGFTGTDPSFEQYRGYENAMSDDEEEINILNQWPTGGMDFSVGFEPFDLQSNSATISQPFGSAMR